MDTVEQLLTDEVLKEFFPPQRADEFFEALFGDASEGAYDIVLRFVSHDSEAKRLVLSLDLHERPGCCLVCNLTYGLPEVFSRHPVININGLVADIEKRLGNDTRCVDWKLGTTAQREKSLHAIPLSITLA